MNRIRPFKMKIHSWAAALFFGTCVAGGALAAPDGRTIAEVRIEGARRIPAQKVLNVIQTRKGQEYSRDRVQEDVRRLDTTNWYYSTAVEEQDSPEGVIVVYRVIERPIAQAVIFEGAKHLTRKELEDITQLRRGSPMYVATNQIAARQIEQHYRDAQGRLHAEVILVEGDKDTDSRIVFNITEGPVVKVKDLEFEGNSFVSNGRLKAQIASRSSFFGIGGKYNPQMIEQDLATLAEYYRNFGFFDVRIRHKIKWNKGGRTVNIVFVINEGVRFLIKDFQIAGNKDLSSEVLLARNTLTEGAQFEGKVMQASAKKMEDEYGSKGYVGARVVPELRFTEQPGSVSVVYQINEGQPVRAGQILIVGNTVTRDHVIRRQIPVYPGQILDTTALRQGEANLRRLNIFGQPRISILDPEGDSEFRDLLVQVEEQPTGSLLFGVGVNSDAGATASIVLNERNFDITRVPTSWDDIWENRAFRGAGQEFRAEVVPGTELSRYSVSWREPFLFDSPYSLGTSAYYYTRRFDEYDERRSGGRVTVGRRLTPYWSASVSMRGEDVKVDDFPPFAPGDFFEVAGNNTLFAPKAALTFDTRDSILRPTAGDLFEVSYEQGLGDFTFPVFTAEHNHYWTVWERPDGSGRHVISFRGQIGIAGDNTPLFERFYAGGFRTMRGFDFRGVGPDKMGFKVGGTFMLLGSIEYQIPIIANDNVYAVVFTDFGTVEDDIEVNSFRASVGAGLRLIVPMFGPVPVALDFGFPVAKEDSDERQVFSFFVGFTR